MNKKYSHLVTLVSLPCYGTRFDSGQSTKSVYPSYTYSLIYSTPAYFSQWIVRRSKINKKRPVLARALKRQCWTRSYVGRSLQWLSIVSVGSDWSLELVAFFFFLQNWAKLLSSRQSTVQLRHSSSQSWSWLGSFNLHWIRINRIWNWYLNLGKYYLSSSLCWK